jgi:hypothetical protein
MCDPINRCKRSKNPQIISGATLTRHNILTPDNKGLIYDEIKLGGLHEKHAASTLNLRTLSQFAWRHKESKEHMMNCPVVDTPGYMLTYHTQSGKYRICKSPDFTGKIVLLL